MSHLSTTFRASGLIAAFAFLICLFAAQNAPAQSSFTVTRTDDRNILCLIDDCSLREAVNAANMRLSNDTITFGIPADDPGCAAGICTITLTVGELTIDSTVTAGTLTITNTSGANNLLISGNNTSRVFLVRGNLTINGITITKGNATRISTKIGTSGGGIYNNGGTLTLTTSIVRDSTVSSDGGGGGITNSGGALNLTNSTITGNIASGGGGGIANLGGILTLTNSTVSGNIANGGGAGIYSYLGDLILTNSTVSGNTGGSVGGGIYCRDNGRMDLTNSTVSGNTGSRGGGIYSDLATSTLTNSTVSGNTATDSGGGIFNALGGFSTSTLNLTSVTVTRNKSTSTACTNCAGGIDNSGGGTVNLKNTIVAGNTVSNAASSPDFLGKLAAGSSFNLIGNGFGTTVSITNGDTNNNQIGLPTSPIDPKLGPLANNGGATQTHSLLFGSPAIDKGNSFGLTTDQRRFARPFNLDDTTYPNAADGSDIGAFELIVKSRKRIRLF